MSEQYSRQERTQRAIAGAGAKTLRVGTLSLLVLGGLSFGEDACFETAGSAIAQSISGPAIVTDGTTGTAIAPIPPFPQSPSGGFAITGGAVVGGNLFHSFNTFSPETAYTLFNLNDPSYSNISNIFSRVTGTTPTRLNGFLQVAGGNSPSLFILNPNGVLIGPGAAMDIPGSLLISTAQSLSFADRTTFSTQDTAPNPLLTVSAPVGLQFGAGAAPISVNGRFTGTQNPQTGQFNPLEAFFFRPGTSVSLLGGGIEINDALFNAFSGQMQLGSVSANSSVDIDAKTHRLTYTPSTEFQNIQMNRSALDVGFGAIDGSSDGSGRITLQGGDIDLRSTHLTSDNISAADGGTIDISASKKLEIADSKVTAALFPGLVFSNDPQPPPAFVPSTGKGGSITISADELVVLPTTIISTDSYSLGDGGDITISAKKAALLGAFDPTLPEPSIQLASGAFDEGNGGNLTINADELEVAGYTFIAAVTFTYPVFGPLGPTGAPAGDGGNVTLNVGDLTIRDWAQIGTGTFSDGDSGDVAINAKKFSFFDYTNPSVLHPTAQITTSVFGGSGKGGDLTINVEGAASLAGDVLITASTYPALALGAPPSALPVKNGGGGNLTFNVGSLNIQDGGQVGTGTFGSGNSGSLEVKAKERIDIVGTGAVPAFDPLGNLVPFTRNSGLFISAEKGSSGEGGSLSVTTPLLSISQGGKLSAETAGSGNAGSITIRAGETIVSDNVVSPFGSPSGIVAKVAASSSGNGGRLEIVGDRLRVLNGGQITASTDGAGKAGDISVRAGLIELEGVSNDGFASTIESRSSTAFGAGSVELTGDRIRITNGGALSVSNLSGGDAGNIQLVANSVYLNNGSVSAETNAGSQGNLTIEGRDFVLMRQGSRLTTNATGTATGGNITLNSPLIVGLENSDISANAIEGNGGNIRLVTQGIIGLALRDRLTPESDITASSELGVDGTVKIESPVTDANSGLAQLPENLEDTSNQVVAGCAAQSGNQFASTGRGGLPDNPAAQLSSNRLWQDMRSLTSPTVAAIPLRNQAKVELVEAQSWQINKAGDVELMTANAINRPAATCLEKIASAQ